MKRVSTHLLIVLALTVITLSATEAQEVAKIYSLQGSVEVKPHGQSSWKQGAKGLTLGLKDEIRTGLKSRAGIRFSAGKLLRLRENSHLVIEEPKRGQKESGSLSLTKGALHLFSRKSQDFPNVHTPEVSASIRGTEFVVATEMNNTTITVLQGIVQMENSHGSITLAKNDEGQASKNSAPIKRVLVDTEDAVQWTFRIPQVLSRKDLGTLTQNEEKAYSKLGFSNVTGAQKLLSSEKSPSVGGNYLKAYTALLSGQFEEGKKILSSLEKSSSPSERERSLYAATRALLELASNDTSSAKELAEQATASNEPATAAYLIQSLTAQSSGDLETALESTFLAVKEDPQNSYAQARLAELHLGKGDTKKALELAQKAVALSPHDAYARGVLGFAYLSRLKSKEAIKTFEDGLKLEDHNGLLHLGLGLGMINQGSLQEGREEIEKAVHLEPNISLYRSYLGKAFFEEEDEDLASNEYEMAIALDPEDPTPYLYRAFNKLSQNRVPGALKDVEESIKRNDARAVYRSKLLLDQDTSVRTTSLAEVFNQLGFSQVARLEAIKSINSDYTNFAAHRLYADSLEGSFLSDARFTQNVIADLLSPVSFNVFQSFNGFSNDPSLNDYAALFDRPGHRGEYTFSGTNQDDLYKGSTVQTGKIGDLGYLASYATDYARGHKSGGDYLRAHRFQLGGNYQLSPDDRVIVQSAYIRREDNNQEYGALLEDFEASIGSYHKLSAQSELVTRFEYLNRNFDNFDNGIYEDAHQEIIADGVIFPFDDTELFLNQMTDEDQRTLRGSLQHIFQSESFNLVTGGQYLYSRGDGDEESVILEDSLDYFTGLDRERNSEAGFNSDSYSLYSYSTVHLSEYADFNAGLNFTEIQLPGYDVLAPFVDGERSEHKLLPKIGLTLYPEEHTIIRSAYFQTLGISNVSDIGTIEPTLVGSFNQVFGDLPGAKAENFGIGIDRKDPSNIYYGAQYIYRDIDRMGLTTESLFTFDADTLADTQSFVTSEAPESEIEHIFNTYFYALLSDSSSATFDYERIMLEAGDIDETNETDRVRARLNYFSPQRWFAFGQASFYNQYLKNVDGYTDGSNDFWLIDIGLGYRLPKRHGAVQFVLKNLLDQDFEFADRGRIDPITNELTGVLEFSVNF